jgi:thiamine biosynthesis protein ThiS
MPDAQGIHVSVNGENVSLPTGRPVAVEHNRRVVPRAEHATVRLNHGDTVEIVTFVGGG